MPKGPPDANKKYTINPTTTGGIPIKEFKITKIIFLKKIFFKAKKYPLKIPAIDAIIKATKLT